MARIGQPISRRSQRRLRGPRPPGGRHGAEAPPRIPADLEIQSARLLCASTLATLSLSLPHPPPLQLSLGCKGNVWLTRAASSVRMQYFIGFVYDAVFLDARETRCSPAPHSRPSPFYPRCASLASPLCFSFLPYTLTFPLYSILHMARRVSLCGLFAFSDFVLKAICLYNILIFPPSLFPTAKLTTRLFIRIYVLRCNVCMRPFAATRHPFYPSTLIRWILARLSRYIRASYKTASTWPKNFVTYNARMAGRAETLHLAECRECANLATK
jgi:hypothetical protein